MGKVVDLEPKDGRGVATIEIEPRYGPIPKDTRVILRQKALLGETYIELTPGDKSAGTAGRRGDAGLQGHAGGGPDRRAGAHVRPPHPARVPGLDPRARRGDREGRGEDLNNAIGNLPDFVATGDDVLAVLDDQRPRSRR